MDPQVGSRFLTLSLSFVQQCFGMRRSNYEHLSKQIQLDNLSNRRDEAKIKLQRLKEILDNLETLFNQETLKRLDKEFVEVFSQISRLLELPSPSKASPTSNVVVHRVTEESTETPSNGIGVHKHVRFSLPEDDQSQEEPFPSAIVSEESVEDVETPIKVTTNSPNVYDLTCHLCTGTQTKFFKRSTMISHVSSQHKISAAIHDQICHKILMSSETTFECPIQACNETFPSKKVIMRHIRDLHTDVYNTLIKVQTMTGHLDDWRKFFTTLDVDDPVKQIEDLDMISVPYDRLRRKPREEDSQRRRPQTRMHTDSTLSSRKRGRPPTPSTTTARTRKSSSSSHESENGTPFSYANVMNKKSATINKERAFITNGPSNSYSDDAFSFATDNPSIDDGMPECLISDKFATPVRTSGRKRKPKVFHDTVNLTSKKKLLDTITLDTTPEKQSTPDQSHQNDVLLSPSKEKPLYLEDFEICHPSRVLRETPPPSKSSTSTSADSEYLMCPKCKELFNTQDDRADHELRFCRYRKPHRLNHTRQTLKSSSKTVPVPIPSVKSPKKSSSSPAKQSQSSSPSPGKGDASSTPQVHEEMKEALKKDCLIKSLFVVVDRVRPLDLHNYVNSPRFYEEF